MATESEDASSFSYPESERRGEGGEHVHGGSEQSEVLEPCVRLFWVGTAP